MATQITKIDDKSDGFMVEFTVVNTYRRTFDARPEGRDQMIYARECVQGVTKNPVEQSQGVYVVPKPAQSPVIGTDEVVELTPPAPPEPPAEPTPAEPPQ